MPDLDDLRRLLERATPGEWRQGNVDTHQVFAPFDDGLAGPGGERVVCTVNDRSDEWDWLADARLIVASVNALPELMTEVERLRSLLAEAREVVRPFAGKSAYFAAKSEDIRRAAEWLRRQEE